MNELINKILETASIKKASDVHLKENEHPWLRINSLIYCIEELPIVTSEEINTWYNSLNIDGNKQKEFEKTGSTDFGFSDDYGHYRVNIYKQSGNIAVAIRILPKEIPDFDVLHLPSSLKELIKNRNGLILVTGATSNGKSTTLASLINEMNKNFKKHIITIEDPIEYRYGKGQALISQREIGSDCLDFYSAFKASLREDPDVVLIGELRDKETIETAIHAAETGHLVLSTLHTSSAGETIDRLISYFDAQEQKTIANKLSTTIKAIITQVLVPLKDNSGVRCAVELLLPIISIMSLVRDNKTYQISSFMRINKPSGIITLEESLANLVKRNLVDYNIAYEACNDKKYFELMLK